MEDIKTLKKSLRKTVREQKAALDESERRQWDARITEHLLSLPEYMAASNVFCYISTGGEPSTFAIIEDIFKSGKTLLVPRVNGKAMDIVKISSLEGMHQGFGGILEPDESLPAVPYEQVDFAVIPALACTSQGVRLGQGGGFYDRFLSVYNKPFALILHKAFLLENIPFEQHDRKVKMIVTEEGVIKI